MKVFFLITVIFITFFGVSYYFIEKKIDYNSRSSASNKSDTLRNWNKYVQKFEELSWLTYNQKLRRYTKNSGNKTFDVLNMLKFLDGICCGNYLDYLELNLDQPIERRITYNQFYKLREKFKTTCEKLIFSYEEFYEVLLYSLILTEIVDSNEYKNKSWVYGTSSLLENIVIHSEIFPTYKKFSFAQMKLVKDVVRVLSDESFFSLDYNRAFLFTSEIDKKWFCRESVEIAFFIYLAKKAGTLLSKDRKEIVLSAGYLSQLIELEQEINYHLE